jgi:hypothetical protein
VADRHLALELGGEQLHLVVGQRLRRRLHLPEVHQDLDQVAHRHAERLREVADGDARLDGDGTGRRRDRLLGRARLGALARLTRVGALRAPGAAVDDDAPLAAGAAGAARPNRSVGAGWHQKVASISVSGAGSV